MPPAHSKNIPVLPTLLDRLIDKNPQSMTDAPRGLQFNQKELIASIHRDLSYLFDAVNMSSEIDLRYPAVANSVLNYGISPLVGTNVLNHQSSQLSEILRQAIIRFEPRLDPATLIIETDVPTTSGQSEHSLKIRIRGRVLLTPHPLEIIVQSAFDPDDGRLTLESVAANP